MKSECDRYAGPAPAGTSSAAADAPLRVSLLDGSELVTTGFAAMLAPYAQRVRVVPQPDPEAAFAPCDMLLVDFALTSPAEVEDLLARVGSSVLVVSYSWAGQPPRGPWWVTVRGQVAGHLDKSLPARRLLERLEAIRRASVPHAASARTVVPHQAGGSRAVRPSRPGRVPTLTPREQDIVSRIARGLSNAEIAEQLYLSINSVKTYVRTAYRKMGVTTRSQAVAWWFSGDLECDRAADSSPDAAPVGARTSAMAGRATS